MVTDALPRVRSCRGAALAPETSGTHLAFAEIDDAFRKLRRDAGRITK